MRPRFAAAWIALLLTLGPAWTADQDIIINEVMYHPMGPDATSELDDDVLEYVELYNRGTEAVDLAGWSFDRGIQYTFPSGTTLGAGEYLVVCGDVDSIRAKYGISNVIGNWTGRLNNQGEHLTLRSKTGESIEGMEYNDRPPWSVLPDGEGPSLERISPAGGNDDPANWAASAVSATNQWIHVVREGTATSSRLYFYLNAAGEVLVDDIKIYRKGVPATDYIVNGGFESGLDPWLVTGNHGTSSVVTSDAKSGTRCLRLVATSAGGSSSNSLNCYTDPDLEEDGPTYVLDFWVKFVSSSAGLVARLSGNGLLGTTEKMGSAGTPGSENSAYSLDIPPFIEDGMHAPAMPSSSDAVTISAKVRDDHAIASVTLQWKPYNATSWTSVAMADDGAHGDGAAGDGVYGARIAKQSTWSRILYRIRAVDSAAQEGWFPRAGEPTGQHGYLVHPTDIVSSARLYYLFVESSDLSRLASSPKTEVPGMVSYLGVLYSNMTVNYRGQTSINNPKKHWKWHFPNDQRFEGQSSTNVNSSWGDKAFIRSYLSYRQFRLAGNAGNLVEYARMYLNGQYLGFYTQIEQSNDDYLRRSGLDTDGNLFKAYSDAKGGTGGFEFQNGRDRGQATSALGSFLSSVNGLTGNSLRDYIAANMDVPSFNAYLAATAVISNIDHPAKNYYIFQDVSTTGRWTMLPWDMDLTWGRNYECGNSGRGSGVYNDMIRYDNHILKGTQAYPKCDGPWNGVINAFLARTTAYVPLYYQRVEELLDRDMNSVALYPLIESLRTLIRPEATLDYQRWNWWGETHPYDFYVDEIKTYVTQRNTYLRNQLKSLPQFPPIESLVCVRSGADAFLTWENPAGAGYDGIRIYRDGLLASTVAGSAEAASVPLDIGGALNRFEVVPVDGGVEGVGPGCTLVVQGSGWVTVVDETFPDDFDPSLWAVNGDATVHGGELHVVDSVDHQVGSAFYRSPISNAAFIAEFEFAVREPEDGGGEGFTFAWIRGASPEVIGAYEGGLGFWGLPGYAVEFDTSRNTAYGDPDANHIAFDDSEDYLAAGSPSAVVVPLAGDLESGAPIQVRITFVDGTLSVAFLGVDGEGQPTETIALETAVPDYILAPSFFGFTGSTSFMNADYQIENLVLKIPNVEAGDPPLAAFDALPLTGSAPVDVTFTNKTTGDVFGYLWDFGDGETSQQTHPVHTYETGGDFTVTLTALGPGGADSETRTSYIHVTEPPKPAFAASPLTGTAPLAVTFANSSIGEIEEYFWQFGDGTTSLEENPTHTYETAGTFTVSLTAVGVGGSATETKEDYIDVDAPILPPKAEFSANTTAGAAPLEVRFANLSTGECWDFLWHFGDGTFSLDPNPVHTYAEPGAYTVSLLAQGPGGSDVLEKEDYIAVNPPAGALFIRGDANRDLQIDIADAVLILGHIFSNAIITCQDAADVDDTAQLDIADPIYLLTYQFVDGPAPAPPFPDPGLDPTDNDPFGCQK
ncbi:MAG: CotH kinase family protein [Planctomycetes bacterium]|nr:CotH kinase family protein [Planctomycetota bacterium]